MKSRIIYIYIIFAGKEKNFMTYKNKTFRRASAAAAAICLAFAFAFAEETGADKLGFGTSVTVSADDIAYIDNASIYYTKDTDGNVTITQVIDCGGASIEIPETIGGGKVTAIGNGAFKLFQEIESITLPNSITSIGDEAFYGCIFLKNINIPMGVTSIGKKAFDTCAYLETIELPQSITSIGEEAFSHCQSLTSITIPSNVTRIEPETFKSCTSLEEIDIPDSVQSIGSNAFSNCTSLKIITIPFSVTSIEDKAFTDCTSLKTAFLPYGASYGTDSIPDSTAKIYYTKDANGNVTISDVKEGNETSIVIPETIDNGTVTVIGDSAFSSCQNLETIALPSNIKSIEKNAFHGCTALKSIDLPDGVNSIGSYAFYHCRKLKDIDIPRSVSSIGDKTFSYCDSLTSVTIHSNITSINESTFLGCTALTNITLSQSITSIGENAFQGCLSLKSIALPSNLKSIGKKAFISCVALTNINIPSSVTNIEEGAFTSCIALESITIPSKVTSIKDYTFYDCTSLKTVFLPYGSTYGTDSIPDSTAKIYYTKDANDNVTISYVEEGNETSIVIPETICGASVTAVGNNAFEVNENITSVILPDSITSIGYNAFFYCGSLQSVKLPKNITSIEKTTFAACHSLTDIEIPENVTSIKAGAFGNCNSLAKVTLPDGLTELGGAAFSDCLSLTEINIPSGITTIGERTFKSCAFATIELPENLQSVGKDAFLDCDDLIKLFYPAGADISAASVPETSAKIKYEIRDGYAYILEIVPDNSNTPVVIPDTIRGYEVKYVEEEYRKYVSETGHTHKGGTATCTEQALCDICGTGYDSTDPTNHDADTSVWKYNVAEHWNPCRRTGCEGHLNIAFHTFDNGVITTKPTETSEGVKICTCEICGYQKTETVPKLGHIPSAEWSYDSDNHWKECIDEICDEKLELAAHTFDNGVITTEPTESSEGVKTYTCEICGYKKTESIEKLPSKPAEVIYPIATSGDVTADKPSAAAGETVNVSAPFGYDIIVADTDGNVIAKISEKGSFTMPSSRVSITAVRGEVFAHMSNAWSHSYVYSYDSDMNRIKVNSDTRRGIITIDLGTDYAGRDFTVYSGRKSTSKKIISGTLDENGRYTFNADEGRNYTLIVE